MADQPEDQAGDGGDPKKPDATPAFDAQDKNLNEELAAVDRARAGSKGAEYGHDETYAPGYHQGGTRFGFFDGHDSAKPPAPGPAKDDKDGGAS
jgi:hypothetical protein